jgi:hypothetical protein
VRTSLFLTTLLLTACQDYEIKGNDDLINGADDEGEPDIAVDPTIIPFGSMDVGADLTAIETVTVTNEGDESLEIHDVRLEDAEMASIYTISAIGAVLVPPGSSTTFTVTFEPQTAVDSNTNVLIDSNDPDEPEVAVQLTGTGVAPIIEISPTVYDFGTLYIGCDSASPTTITNVGNADLVISDFRYVSASDDLFFDDNESINGPLPWTLSPGSYLDVYVDYAPLDDYSDEGYLTVSSNDPFQPEAQAHQNGAGALYGANLDVFEQPLQGMTDIIFTLDWSCSMSEDIARVQANFDTFVATLQTMDADYHVSVVTDDDGCINGSQPYIDNSMSSADQTDLFDTMVNNYSYGAYTEMGFTLLEAATTSTNLGSGGCNEDMLRDDATLAMIGITDEVEQSANPWSYYVSLFQSLKSDPDDLVIHAIAGDYPSGCSGNEPGMGWYEASVATGGLFLSICATDWASHLEAIAEGSAADLSSFELTAWPVPETIVVRVDGITTTTGWSYNATDRSVEFEESSIPEGGSTIEIEYALFGECEG